MLCSIRYCQGYESQFVSHVCQKYHYIRGGNGECFRYDQDQDLEEYQYVCRYWRSDEERRGCYLEGEVGFIADSDQALIDCQIGVELHPLPRIAHE